MFPFGLLLIRILTTAAASTLSSAPTLSPILMSSNSNQEKQAGLGGNQSSTLPQILMGYNPNWGEQDGFGGDNMYQYIPSLQIASTPGGSLINATSASINSGGTPSGFNDNGVGRASSSNPQASMNKRNGSHQKQRFNWTQEHHQSFLEVIELLETQNGTSNRKVVPRKILEEMRKRYPNITREIIASHLQKHRLHLKNLNNRELNNSATSLNSQLLLQSPSFVINPNSQVPQSTCSSSKNLNFNVPPHTHSRSKNPNPQPPLRIHSRSESPNSCPSSQNHSSLINPKYYHRSHLNPNNHPRSHLNPNYHSENANCHPLPQTHFNSINPNCDPLPQTHLISNDPNYQSIPQTHLYFMNPHSNSNDPNYQSIPQTHFNTINPNSNHISPCPPPISHNQTSSLHPIIDNPLEALNNPNFFQDYNMNFNSDVLQFGGAVDNNMSLPLDSCCPINLNPNFQMNYKQALQSMQYPDNSFVSQQNFDNHMANDSILHQRFDSYVESDSTLLQSVDTHPLVLSNICDTWVEPSPNLERINEPFTPQNHSDETNENGCN